MESLLHDQFTRLSVTLWAIWSARRKAIHEEIYQSPLSIHGFINSYLKGLKGLSKRPLLVNLKDHWIQLNGFHLLLIWLCASIDVEAGVSLPISKKKTPSNLTKINVDAAVSKHEDIGVAAACCRDHTVA
jgi:hypothetical protein